ncbi:MAG: hypothetical protein ACRD5H_12340 [Nitrososphaerales archaeon]
MKEILEIASEISTPLAFCALIALIVFLLLRQIIAKRISPENVKLIIKTLSLVFVIAILFAFASYALTNVALETHTNGVIPQEVESISIRMINDEPIPSKQPIEVGYGICLKGTLSNASHKAYIIVKPISSGDPNWYVQPPAPVILTGDGREWEGKAYLGTSTEGIEERFSVFAIITSEDYKPEQKLTREPEGIKSNRITCLRITSEICSR